LDCIEILRSPPYSLPEKQITLRSGKPSARAMLDLATLNHFSRCNCVAICAVLIPVNLLISTAVIALSALNLSPRKRQRLAILGLFPALLLVSHVASWWVVGVVAPASFLLPSIALLCTIVNWLCLWKPEIVQQQYGSLRNRFPARTQVLG
jgi:hypothetical protein